MGISRSALLHVAANEKLGDYHLDRTTTLCEHRIAPRKRVLKTGSIEFGGGTIDCTVRNLSETGAALLVESPIGIPTTFKLVNLSDRTSRMCQVVWRTENRVGVRFT